VRLTAEGERQALRVIRRHRLWEVFLVETLGFGWDGIHDIAEELEHIGSEELVARLDAFLDYPQFDPHGDPIPTPTGAMPATAYRPLSETQPGDCVRIMGVLTHATAFLQHLNQAGLTLGCTLTVQEISAFDRSLRAHLGDEPPVFISHEVARNLLVA
jgi:DtxR family transcriptional regulator, Mn-dependent transcriptional regulator